MKIFPHVLIRVGGNTFDGLERLNAHRSIELMEKISAARRDMRDLQEQICEALYLAISQAEDNKIQNSLLTLKRDVYNGKKLSEQQVKKLTFKLPQVLRNQIEDYASQLQKITGLIEQGADVYQEEVRDTREAFRELVRDDSLQHGLVISSQSLLKSSRRYLAKKISALNKKDYKTELGLLKYVTRICAKTSPFSTFTNLTMGKVGETPSRNGQGSEILYFGEEERPSVVSHIRLNNFLFQYLKGLLTKNPEIYRQFLLRPNPTLKNNGDHYLFLTNSNNVESFQRVPANPVLEVFQVLSSQKKEGIVYQELIELIVRNEYIDAPPDALAAYIDQLIEYGFLEYNIGVSGIDPDWDIKLRKVLQPLAKKLPLIKQLIDTLSRVRAIAEEYGKAPLAEREILLKDAFQRFREICMVLHKAAGLPEEERKTREELQAEARKKREELKQQEEAQENGEAESKEKEEDANKEFKHQAATYFYFKPEQMFYEDTSLEMTPVVNKTALTQLVATLNDSLQDLRMFEGRQEEKFRMFHFFRKKYGNSSDSVNLLAFYEDYYRDVRKPEEEKEAERQKAQWEEQNQKNAKKQPGKREKSPQGKKSKKKSADKAVFPVPAIRLRREQCQKWLDRFQKHIQAKVNGANLQDQVNLSYEQVRATNKQETLSDGQGGSSYGMFVQFYQEIDEHGRRQLKGVLNASLTGFGKMFSRFLHIFEETTRDMREWNVSLADDKLFIEDCDASYFNANLHPPLMPYEIWMPGGHNSLDPEQQIPVTELEVEIDRHQSLLKLVHKPTQKQIHVFDLGFQGQMGRSPLYRLLETFTAAEYLSCYPLVTGVNNFLSARNAAKNENGKKETSRVSVIPRIIFEGRLVLRRKTWLVPKAHFPIKEPREGNWEYFLKVDQWRRALEMPGEIFAFANPDRSNQQAARKDPEAYKRLGRDDYKPQYINFNSPLLVVLFEKLIQKVPEILKIEEMLPNSQQLQAFGNSRRVTEYVVQWYTQSTMNGELKNATK